MSNKKNRQKKNLPRQTKLGLPIYTNQEVRDLFFDTNNHPFEAIYFDSETGAHITPNKHDPNNPNHRKNIGLCKLLDNPNQIKTLRKLIRGKATTEQLENFLEFLADISNIIATPLELIHYIDSVSGITVLPEFWSATWASKNKIASCPSTGQPYQVDQKFLPNQALNTLLVHAFNHIYPKLRNKRIKKEIKSTIDRLKITYIRIQQQDQRKQLLIEACHNAFLAFYIYAYYRGHQEHQFIRHANELNDMFETLDFHLKNPTLPIEPIKGPITPFFERSKSTYTSLPQLTASANFSYASNRYHQPFPMVTDNIFGLFLLATFRFKNRSSDNNFFTDSVGLISMFYLFPLLIASTIGLENSYSQQKNHLIHQLEKLPDLNHTVEPETSFFYALYSNLSSLSNNEYCSMIYLSTIFHLSYHLISECFNLFDQPSKPSNNEQRLCSEKVKAEHTRFFRSPQPFIKPEPPGEKPNARQ